MKRITILLFVLLALTTPALAESPTAQSVVTEAYPGATILASAEDADDAFFVLDMGSYKPRRLCGLTLTDGAWTLVIDSDTAVRPSGLSDEYQRWNYDKVALSLTADTLSIIHQGWYSWQYDFARDDAGQWRFVRLYVADDVNLDYDELTWADGCVSQTSISAYRDGTQEKSCTPPCPMPWLADCETLAGFDATAFPMNLYALGDEDLSRVAAQLLPEYTYKIGKFGWDAASFLMIRPDGEVVFCGGVYEDGAWTWTESTPLPEDTWCDDYHSGGSSFIIGFDHPDDLITEWDEPVYIEYVIYLQEDGSWKVETIFNISEEAFHFVPDGLYINMTGLVYGESTLERDVTKIDWATFPMCLEDVLPTMSHDWGVISEPTLPLYADADGAILLAEYRYATPVRILEEADDLVKVQIADSDVVGWLPAYGVLTGQYQVWETVEEDEDGVWSYHETAEYYAPGLLLAEGASLYAAPEGEPLWTVEGGNEWLVFMADYGDGWAHVKCGDSLESCFVRLADCVPED